MQVPVFAFITVTHLVPTATLLDTCLSQTLVDSSTLASDPLSDPSSIHSPPPTPSPVSPSSPGPNDASDAVLTDPTTSRSDDSGLMSSVTYTAVTSLSTQSGATSSVPSSSTTDLPLQNTSGSSNSTGGIVGPIVGGVLGGFFGLIATVVIIWFCWYVLSDFLV